MNPQGIAAIQSQIGMSQLNMGGMGMPQMPMQGQPQVMASQPMVSGYPNMAQQSWIEGVSRPNMTRVANPPVVASGISYGPSYQMSYNRRSDRDKTAVKYTGYLPLEGVYEEDTCRIG